MQISAYSTAVLVSSQIAFDALKEGGVGRCDSDAVFRRCGSTKLHKTDSLSGIDRVNNVGSL